MQAWHLPLLIVTYCELTVPLARHQLLHVTWHGIFIKKLKQQGGAGIFD